LHEKSERGRARGASTSRNVLSVIVNDDDDDNDDDDESIRRSKEEGTLPRGGRELRTRVEGKFEIRKPVFSLYHVRDDPIPPRVRGQCSMRVEKEEPAIVSIAIGINLSGRSIDNRQLLSSVRSNGRANAIAIAIARIELTPGLTYLRRSCSSEKDHSHHRNPNFVGFCSIPRSHSSHFGHCCANP